jgi:hypothetical protein
MAPLQRTEKLHRCHIAAGIETEQLCSRLTGVCTVSWPMSMPRSNSRSSTFRNDSGNRTYITTTRRTASGEALK